MDTVFRMDWVCRTDSVCRVDSVSVGVVHPIRGHAAYVSRFLPSHLKLGACWRNDAFPAGRRKCRPPRLGVSTSAPLSSARSFPLLFGFPSRSQQRSYAKVAHFFHFVNGKICRREKKKEISNRILFFLRRRPSLSAGLKCRSLLFAKKAVLPPICQVESFFSVEVHG